MKLWLVASLLNLVSTALARPALVISDDRRGHIYMGSFGFLAGGTFDMDLTDLKLKTTEINPGMNYLSAGDIPLPKVYGASAIAYLAAGHLILAIMIGIQKTFQTIKIHYMQTGSNSEGWTVMFYIFAFIKPFLNEKDKRIILVIIPLQTQIFPMVNLISFVVILGVIVQTQRHLSEAAEAEGKIAENKSKYKLWGSFYIVTVVYIYLIRIMVQFLRVSLPYQYVNWLVELLNEIITLGFYITIGWKFRPYANNPYILVEEDDLDREDIEAGTSGSAAVGPQTMSRREGQGA
ncbi:hypothetical protein BG005_007239 [Podila minutissima]|nr:hypothetical protein BG005_007239 [Podila minutissima]